MTELDKEFVDSWLTTFNSKDKPYGEKALIEQVKEYGGVVGKEYYKGDTIFVFKNGRHIRYMPGVNKFNMPLM